MKKSMLIAAGAILLMFACQENQEEDVVGPEVEMAVNNESPFEINPLEELFATDMSNGLFYVADHMQAITMVNGQLQCSANMPNEEFVKLEPKPNAASGIYISSSGSILYEDEGNGLFKIEYVAEPFINDCLTRSVFVPDNCPNGTFGGGTTYIIRDCYIRFISKPVLVSSDTIRSFRLSCLPLLDLDQEFYFEDVYGNKILNPICL